VKGQWEGEEEGGRFGVVSGEWDGGWWGTLQLTLEAGTKAACSFLVLGIC
jgi:hypothetical protein